MSERTTNPTTDLSADLPFVRQLRSAEAGFDAAGPAVLGEVRRAAVARYAALGFPHAKTEAWKYTNLNVLKGRDFEPADAADGAVVTAVPDGVVPIDGPRIVLANGRLRTDLSDIDALPKGVTVASLADAAGDADVAAALRDDTVFDAQPLAALGTAFLGDGVVVRIAAGAAVEPVLHLISIGAVAGPAPGGAKMTAPRVLILAGDGAIANLVESHVGLGGVERFANIVTQVSLGAGAVLGHYKLQAEPETAYHIATTRVTAADRAVYDSFVLSTGGALARSEIRGLLAGSRVEYRVNGAYLGRGTQHLDTTTFIDHAEPDSHSSEVYKGVLAGRARGVFQGKILVRRDAQRTDGYQMNRALLLSRQAEIDSKPELEIYADDVKCSHGATVGELEADQLFYLMARGIPKDRARAVLVEAYVAEAIDEIRSAPVREAFQGIASGWLAALAETEE